MNSDSTTIQQLEFRAVYDSIYAVGQKAEHAVGIAEPLTYGFIILIILGLLAIGLVVWGVRSALS